jgi:hypothetical protein
MFLSLWQIIAIGIAFGAAGYSLHVWLVRMHIEEQKMWHRMARQVAHNSPSIMRMEIKREIENLEHRVLELREELKTWEGRI